MTLLAVMLSIALIASGLIANTAAMGDRYTQYGTRRISRQSSHDVGERQPPRQFARSRSAAQHYARQSSIGSASSSSSHPDELFDYDLSRLQIAEANDEDGEGEEEEHDNESGLTWSHLTTAGTALAGQLIVDGARRLDEARRIHSQGDHFDHDLPDYFTGPGPVHAIVGAAVGNVLYHAAAEPAQTLSTVRECVSVACRAAASVVKPCCGRDEQQQEGEEEAGAELMGERPSSSNSRSSSAIKRAARAERMTRSRQKQNSRQLRKSTSFSR